MMKVSSVLDSVGDKPVSVSFSGSGFLVIYQLGVVQGLLDNAPWVLRQAPKLYGASAGSLVAAAVACGADIGCVREEILTLTRKYAFGFIQFSHLEQVLREILPQNAHQLANGRLHVSMTRIPDGHNILVSEFHSREDLIQALLCSCFVPGFCGVIPPCYRGVHYIDGGLTNIQPTQDCPTLTVSPFAGDVDICPSDASVSFCDLVINQLSVQATLPNLIRITNALFPRDLRALNKAFYNGYQDALFFLQQSRPVCFYADWVTPLKDIVVDSNEMWLPLENPLQVVTENSSLVGLNQDNDVDTLGMASNVKPTGQAIEVLICNIVAHLGMVSILSAYLPPRAMPYLLLPLTVIVWASTTFISRVQPWVLYASQVSYWLWQDLKHMIRFVLSITISTLRKGVQLRKLMLSLHLSRANGHRSPSLHHNHSIIPSLHSLFFTLEMRRRHKETQQNIL